MFKSKIQKMLVIKQVWSLIVKIDTSLFVGLACAIICMVSNSYSVWDKLKGYRYHTIDWKQKYVDRVSASLIRAETINASGQMYEDKKFKYINKIKWLLENKKSF